MKMPAPATENAKYIACAEIVPDCPFTATGATDDELVKQVAVHAAHEHGIADFTPELEAKVKAAITTR
jgi:predicted small metal-binding protein